MKFQYPEGTTDPDFYDLQTYLEGGHRRVDCCCGATGPQVSGQWTDEPGDVSTLVGSVMSDPVPGTTRFLCPLQERCDWYHDLPPASLEDLAGISPEPGPPTLDHYVASVVRQGIRRQALEIDAVFFAHLSQHTTVEFVDVIHRLRTELAGIRAFWETP